MLLLNAPFHLRRTSRRSEIERALKGPREMLVKIDRCGRKVFGNSTCLVSGWTMPSFGVSRGQHSGNSQREPAAHKKRTRGLLKVTRLTEVLKIPYSNSGNVIFGHYVSIVFQSTPKSKELSFLDFSNSK